jgi:uncharacterized membrane protein
MVIGFTLTLVAVLIVGIWVFIELKRLKHKLFAMALIGFILLLYASSSFVFHGHDIQWNTASGVMEAGNLYLSWLGSVFVNLKSVTMYAIKMDWKTDTIIQNNSSLNNSSG